MFLRLLKGNLKIPLTIIGKSDPRIEQRYVTEIDGQPCKTYIDWFSITFALTMTSCPVLSLPCGFTEKGLPVGLQIVARPRGEAELLRDGFRMEEIFGMAVKLPINPKP